MNLLAQAVLSRPQGRNERISTVTLVALDPQGDVARAWGVKVFPTTVLIDPSGRARQRIRGEVDWSSHQALGWIEALLRP